MLSEHASSEVVDAQISRCADARTDADRLRAEVFELKALTHPRAAFAAALFELDRARKGAPDARAAMLDVADSLLAFWKDKSGPELAQSHPALEELWAQAEKLLSGFERKRLQPLLDACWVARADAGRLAQAVAELGSDDDRRTEFARCLYHLELARQLVDGSRQEFARRAALLQEAYLDHAVAEELVGGDPGLEHLWTELLPYLDEFFESLDEAKAKAAAAQAAARAEAEAAAGPAVTAPTSPMVEVVPGPAPSARPSEPRPPLSTQPQPPAFATATPAGGMPSPPTVDAPPRASPARVAPQDLPEVPPLPAAEPSWADAWPGLASLRHPVEPAPPEPTPVEAAPPQRRPRNGAAPTAPAEAFDATKTAPVMEALPPLEAEPPPRAVREFPVTQPVELPAELLDEVDTFDGPPPDLNTTLPPDGPRLTPAAATLPPDGPLAAKLHFAPPPLPNDTLPPGAGSLADTLRPGELRPGGLPPPPPDETLPPGVLARTIPGLPEGETLDPDALQEVPPPPPGDASSPDLLVDLEEEPDPGPVTQAFWRGTEVALGLLPPADAPRLNTRVFAADDRKERKKLTHYLEDVRSRFTEAEVPESKAMQCLLKLYLAAHLKEKSLFGQKNEKRVAGFREALGLLGRDPRAAAHCAVWFELDGPRTVEKLNDGLEVLMDYLQYCARHRLDPLAPTSPALFLS